MRTIRPLRAAALLAVLALLLAAWPAAAAPGRTTADDPGVVSPLFDALTAWLATLWPGTGPPPAPEPQADWGPLGPVADPGGAPQPESGGPTGRPQLGPDADPDG
jgi:hypothetical protein